VYFLPRICAAAALIVISPYAVTHSLRYHHLHTAFQVSSHIAICYRSTIAILSCNSTFKSFVFFFVSTLFPLEFILILDSIFLTCFLQIAVFFSRCCHFARTCFQLRVHRPYFAMPAVVPRPRHRHHHGGTVVTTVHSSSVGKTN